MILVLAVGVAVSLRTWPFFVQRRPGWHGRELTIVKLRTLPATTPTYADKRVLGIDQMALPRLCSLMRKTHLDELPQLFSVVLGHMSLVGPRPALPNNVEPVSEDFEALRRSVRPGCTGLWQLSVASSNTATSAPRFDILYVNCASTLLDVWIIVRTLGWIFGLVKPIEVEDIPRWLCGPGIANGPVVHEFADPQLLEEPVGWYRPEAAARELDPQARASSAPPSRDAMLADIAD